MRNKDKSQGEEGSVHSHASRYDLSTLFYFFVKTSEYTVYLDSPGLLSILNTEYFTDFDSFLRNDLEIVNMPHPKFFFGSNFWKLCCDLRAHVTVKR